MVPFFLLESTTILRRCIIMKLGTECCYLMVGRRGHYTSKVHQHDLSNLFYFLCCIEYDTYIRYLSTTYVNNNGKNEMHYFNLKVRYGIVQTRYGTIEETFKRSLSRFSLSEKKEPFFNQCVFAVALVVPHGSTYLE